MTVTCTQCGSGSPPGNRFCGQCGAPLPPSPGNLPVSARWTQEPSSPAPAGWGAATPCWGCGNAVDPTRQPACPTCGAALTAPAQPAMVPSAPRPAPQTPLGPPPPIAFPAASSPHPPDAPPRRDSAISGLVLTAVVAIGIVLVLAVLGILAGQVIGR